MTLAIKYCFGNFQQKFPGHSEMSWKSDLKIVAIGNDDG